MVQLIDGKKIAERIKMDIAQAIFKFNGPRPNLAIILVGEREDSQLYVSLKEREGKRVGVDTHLYKLDKDVAEEELLQTINFLNSDPLIDGILVQLPLPEKFNTDEIIAALNPQKDVDGFHPAHPPYVLSPVLASIQACLEDIGFEPTGKTACVLNNSEIFGDNVKQLLENLGLTVTLKENPERADLLISALGQAQTIKKENIKAGAVIVDIGITKVNGQVYGDVDFADVKDKASYITPVPGGIGPLTIAFLFKNVLEIFKRKAS